MGRSEPGGGKERELGDEGEALSARLAYVLTPRVYERTGVLTLNPKEIWGVFC